MDRDEARETYLELLQEMQALERALPDGADDLNTALAEVRTKLETAKRSVFADPATGAPRDRDTRAKARQSLQDRIEFLKSKIGALEGNGGGS